MSYACSICGYHPDSDSMWCGAGCGRDYNEMTRIVLDPFWDGILSQAEIHPQAVLELNDYAMLLRDVPKVYEHVTGGRISKPDTIASAVIAEADDYWQRELDNAMKEIEAYAAEGWAWLDEALAALGVKTVFDIPKPLVPSETQDTHQP